MHYKSPIYENRPQWVPIVVKNRDWLIGYINGIKMIETLVIESLETNGIEVNLNGIELCLDSSRFNDVMENGEKESECTKEEVKKYYQGIIEEKIDFIKENHPDNNNTVFDDCFMEVECVCGLGVYTFKDTSEIPGEDFMCQICGRTIINYTHKDDDDFDYDGDDSIRNEAINDQIIKEEDEDETDE